MNGLTDAQLLGEYAERHAEAAFDELVRRHVDLVYAAALRMVRDAHLAEDVTKQKGLSKETPAPEAAEALKQIMEQFKAETQPFLTPEQTKIFAEVVTHFQVEPGKFGYNFNF